MAVRDSLGNPLTGIIAIAAGDYFSLALRADGTVLAWGYNGYGQLGDGSTTQSTVPRLLREQNGGAITQIVAISAGSSHAVALKADGHLLGWGANGSGQLGDDNSTGRYRAVAALDTEHLPLTTVVGVSAQGDFTLARLRDGRVQACGYNGYGQLGDGTTRSRGYPLPVVDAAYIPVGAIAAVAGGWRHGLALIGSGTQTGHLLAWGEDSQGQLGDGARVNRSRAGAVRNQAGGELAGVRVIAAGGYHSLALLADGTLRAWGDNSDGQIGDGTKADQAWPVPVRDGNAEPVSGIGQPGNPADPALDSDGDGTPDSRDAFPYDARYKTDSDRDGLPDEWELTWFGNLATANAGTDSDGDGVRDRDEFDHGSDPRVGLPIAATEVIAVGVNHSLALQRDGSVLAWGYNGYYGQLGDGTTTDRSYPTRIPGLTNIRALAAGDNHSLALSADGHVWAWGYNGYGQLGRGNTTASQVPVQVLAASGSPLAGIIAIGAGDSYSLALAADGTVWAWGYNGSGQLADGTGTTRTLAQQVGDANGRPLVGITAIAAGSDHALALKSDGRVLAWGYNGYGQLGDNTTSSRQRAALVLDDGYLALTGIVAIAAGGRHSLALDRDGQVFAWGYNGYGQLGEGSTTNRYLPEWVVGADGFPLKHIRAIAAGESHSLALGSGFNLLGWGRNEQGQLGDGGRTDRRWAAAVVDADGSPPTQVQQVAAGGSHALALRVDGTLLGWGDNGYGQVGDGSQWDRPWAVVVWDGNLVPIGTIGRPVAADSDGDGTPDGSDAFPSDRRYHLDSDHDGMADEWEQAHFGNLTTAAVNHDSDGDGVSDLDEFAHDSDPRLAPARQGRPIAAGGYHSLALQSDGTLLAWGGNGYGQLGDGTTVAQSHPKRISAVSGIAAVAAGAYHSLALGRDGRVWAWGYNGNGQLGDGTTTSRSVPVAVRDSLGNPLAGIIAITAGDRHSLALRADGTVLVWGYNGYGQLGDGSTTQSGVPRLLREQNGGAITRIIAIGAGSNHSVALKADGHLLGWGYNGSGQLGDDSSSSRYRAVPALDAEHRPLTTVAGVSAQGDFTLVRLADGHAQACGYNGYGQLGDGTTRSHGYPLPVVAGGYLPVTGVSAVAGGWRHGLALIGNWETGRLLAWGEDTQGQLGDGNWVNRARADAVRTAAGGELAGVQVIAGGAYHSLALLGDGTLFAWGDNSSGQLGSGPGADRRVATPVTDAAGQPIANLPHAALDSDGDGIADTRDNCPTIANPGQEDLDRDGLGNACDPDADGDGVPNAQDAFPLDPTESVDTDGDGIGNNADPDDDNDGVPDAQDAYPLDPTRHLLICRVKAGSTARPGDGATWPSAYPYLQDALTNARCGEFWVAAGRYYPDLSTAGGNTNSPAASFSLSGERSIYGGFAGTEERREQRDARANPTVLSGDLAQDDLTDGQGVTADADDIRGFNAYHVVRVTGAPPSAVLDGLTITAGQALAAAPDDCGGGLLNGTASRPRLANLTLRGNTATRGGGLCNRADGTPVLTAVTLAGNAADANGGGLYNASAGSVTLTNSTLAGNRADGSGGAIENAGSGAVTLSAVTLADNAAVTLGGAIHNAGAGPVRLGRSLLGRSSGAAHCAGTLIDDGYNLADGPDSCGLTEGTSQPDTDPLVGPLADNGGITQTQALDPASPAVDAIDTIDCTGEPGAVDQRGLPRPQGAGCDIGAYERLGLGAVLVNPPTGNWTVSPQSIAVAADHADRIYYTLRSTTDGTAPADPPEPSATTNDGSIAGASGVLQLLAGSTEYKRIKLRLRAHTSDGYGIATGVYTYTIARAPLPRFGLTVNKSGTGTVTSSPAGIDCGSTCTATYDSGTLVTLTASPATGATFANWSGPGGCTGTGTCSVTLTAARSVTATFSVATYSIAAVASPTAGGTVTCTPNPVTHGSSSTCTAAPGAGYTFAAFSGACTGASCTLKNVTATPSVTATFTLKTYPITATATPAVGGTVTCTPNPVGHGANSTCAATPNAGYSFKTFSGACTGAGCTLTNVTAAKSVTATFSVATYPITATANPVAGGTVTCKPNPVTHGGSSACTAAPKTGYTFSGFSGACTGAKCALSNVTAAQGVTATFTLKTYPITVIAKPTTGGTLSCTPNPVDHGAGSTCTATPNTGYTFGTFSGACTGARCALTNVTAAKSVTANFNAATYPITATANPVAGGTVTCKPNPVTHGGTGTCTATPKTGYTFSGFSGACTGAGCTLTNVTAAQGVTANFSLKTYLITAAANPVTGGTVTCTPNPVPHGGGSTCTATPNTGYTFSAFSGACTGARCVLTNVTAAKSLTAGFLRR